MIRATPKKLRAIVLAVASLLLLSACSRPTTSAADLFSITATDAEEISISPTDLPVHNRVVALANGSAEIILAMGMKSVLVGRDIASSVPTLRDVPIVTSGHQVIPEKIISLQPDLVIIDASTGPLSALTVLRQSKINVQEIKEAWNLADIRQKVEAIGLALGTPKSAGMLNAKIAQSIVASQLTTQSAPRVAFLYLRGTSSIYLMGGPGSGADSLLAAIGARDVGAQTLPHPFNSLTSEALVNSKPDVFLVMSKGLDSVGGVKGLLALPGIAQTPAGVHRRIIAVDDSLLLSFGPRTPALIAALSKDLVLVMKK